MTHFVHDCTLMTDDGYRIEHFTSSVMHAVPESGMHDSDLMLSCVVYIHISCLLDTAVLRFEQEDSVPALE